MAKERISKITVKGFRSIKELTDFEPNNINVFIGPNGAGKSNFIQFFSFLSYILQGELATRTGYLGGASDVLHDGPDVTPYIDFELSITTDSGVNDYKLKLAYSKPDRLTVALEQYRFSGINHPRPNPTWRSGSKNGADEVSLPEIDNRTAKAITAILKKIIIYQFHNTTDTAGIRLSWSVDDSFYLKSNGQNLGSFLYRLQKNESAYYRRIVGYLRMVLPFFDDFVFFEEYGKLILRWREKNSVKVFHAGQASDGMLRCMALTALLAQNPQNLPAALFIDEPELGLHPAAIDLLADLIHIASVDCQIFIATQSVTLVDRFEPENIIVIDRQERASVFNRYCNQELSGYLQEYSLSEAWQNNFIGGGPQS